MDIPLHSDRDLLVKLATDIDYIKTSMDAMTTERDECERICNKRIGKLERWQANVIGVSATVSIIITLLASIWK